MKVAILMLALAFCALFVACASHDAEVNAFIAERNAVVPQMIEKIDSSPNQAGIDAARKIFEAKKADLRAKRDALKNVKISWELYQKLLHFDTVDSKAFDSVYDKKIMELSANPAVNLQFSKLRDEYMDTVRR